MSIYEGLEIGEAGEGQAGGTVDEAGNISTPEVVAAPPREEQWYGIISGKSGIDGPHRCYGVWLPV